MADTTYVDGTVITSDSLNAFNTLTYHAANGTVGTSARTGLSKFADVLFLKDFGAIGDGTTDDTTAIAAAFASGAKILDGSGLTYKTTAQVNLPAGVQFRNATLQLANTPYLGLGFNSNCIIQNVVVLGTAMTNQYPSAQRGIGEQTSGSSNVKIDARVDNCNICFDFNGTTDSYIRAFANNASGQLGVSEGYSCLLYNSASRNGVYLNSKNPARHSLYISSGSSQNTCVVHSSGCQSQWAVQINSTKAQAICSGNVVSGTSYNDTGGVIMFMDTAGSDTGGCVRDNTIRDFEVIGVAATNVSPAFELNMTNAGTTPATGNKFINCKASGQFNSTTLGVMEIISGWNTTVDGLSIRAISFNTTTGAISLNGPAGGIQKITNVNIDLLTSGATVPGSYFNVTNGYYTFEHVQIVCPSSTKVFYSGSSSTLRLGDGNKFNANVLVTAVSATSSKTTTINVPSHLQNSYLVIALITSQSVSSNISTDVQVTSKGATSFVLTVYNGHSAPQDITVDYRIVGLPG